jgi:hypothetical protein
VTRTSDPRGPLPANDELSGALRALGVEPVRVDVGAAFFHRTIARWLGLPEGRVPGAAITAVDDDVLAWDYALWKAELARDDDSTGEAVGHGVRRERWSATLYRVADAAPERVAWTVDKDARGAIVASAWRTAAPRLVDELVDDVAAAPRAGADVVDAALLARLVDDA